MAVPRIAVRTASKPSPKILFVLVGQVVVMEEPFVLTTVLGSCVSVCIWDKKTLRGGMNHFLVPETVNDATSLSGGIASTRLLVESMLKFSGIKNLEAKIFGGSNRFFTDKS